MAGSQTWTIFQEYRLPTLQAFFNGLLASLGVEDVKVAEVFTVDPDDVDTLMLPSVYSFQHLLLAADLKHDTANLFSDSFFSANMFLRSTRKLSNLLQNYGSLTRLVIPLHLNFPSLSTDQQQTMANGCATLALLNILMNKPEVHIGSDLSDFKATTAPLVSPLRGWLLEEHPILRQKHNAYARCLEHLNADLFLSNEHEGFRGWPQEAKKKASASSSTKKRARKSTSGTSSSSSRKRRRVTAEDACHYKAFVFSEGHVWVLDGLEDRPVSLGPATPETWMTVALGAIQSKVQDAAGADDMCVNVLAVCRAPTATLRAELRDNIKALSRLRASLDTAARPPRQDGRLYLDIDGDDYRLDDKALEPYGLTKAKLQTEDESRQQPEGTVSASAPDRGSNDELLDVDTCRAKIADLELEQLRIQSEYRQEMSQAACEEERCSGRKKDYGQVVHRWVSKIAARGALQGLLG